MIPTPSCMNIRSLEEAHRKYYFNGQYSDGRSNAAFEYVEFVSDLSRNKIKEPYLVCKSTVLNRAWIANFRWNQRNLTLDNWRANDG